MAGSQAAVALQNQAGGIGGRKVELIRIPADSTPASVSAEVRSALAAHPDLAAFIGLSDTDLALAAGREARQAGKVFVTSGATSPLLPDEVGKGFFLACFGDDVQAAAAGEALLGAFHGNYPGGEVDAFSGLGFDAARVLMDGLARGGDLAEEIKRRTMVEGLTGAIRYDEGRRVPAKPVAIIDAEHPGEVLSQETIEP